MEQAFAWLNDLIHWFAQFVPRWAIIGPTHGGCKFVWGSHVKTLGPGWHLWWPLSTHLHVYPTARQATDLRAQVITTSDDKSILVGGLITYEIKDIEAILARTYDPEETINDLALTAFHEVCCRKDWQTIKDGQKTGALDREIRESARKALERYGVRVLKTSLTDLAPCTVMKLVTHGPHGAAVVPIEHPDA